MLQKKLNAPAIALVIGVSLSACQSTQPPLAQEPPPPEFPQQHHDLAVTGRVFSIDVLWDQKQDLQSQQDATFALANAYDTEKKVHQYVKTERSTTEASQYLLKSGVQLNSQNHDFDTFMQYRLKTHCEHRQQILHCEYKAIEGVYTVDLPEALSLKGDQTPEQMEQSEITTLAKINSAPLRLTETFTSSLSLSQLKTRLIKKRFIVESKKSKLYLTRPQYNYEVEISQEKKTKQKQYVVTANYEINPIKNDVYSADYTKPIALAKKDLNAAINQ